MALLESQAALEGKLIVTIPGHYHRQNAVTLSP